MLFVLVIHSAVQVEKSRKITRIDLDCLCFDIKKKFTAYNNVSVVDQLKKRRRALGQIKISLAIGGAQACKDTLGCATPVLNLLR